MPTTRCPTAAASRWARSPRTAPDQVRVQLAQAQDKYAIESSRRARAANEDGSFEWEMAPVTVAGRKGETVVERDEGPFKTNPDKIPTLKPAFRKEGTVTAATSSSISDGAAAMVLMRRSMADKLGAQAAGHDCRPCHPLPRAPVVHHRAGRRDRQALREDRMEHRQGRSLRDQRGVRRGGDVGDEGAFDSRMRRSTSMAAQSRWATRSAHPARA